MADLIVKELKGISKLQEPFLYSEAYKILEYFEEELNGQNKVMNWDDESED